MRPTKTRTMIAITLGAWLATVGSASALTYKLTRPSHGVAPAASLLEAAPQAAAPERAAPDPVAEPLATPEAPVLYMPVVLIVSPRLPGAAMKSPAPESPPMQCSDWRALDMGHGHVQECR
jgi:hypothetical protein